MLMRFFITAVLLVTAGLVSAQPGSGGMAANSSVETASDMHVSRVVLLGTGGGPRLRTERSQIATLLIVDDRPYLIDAGFGVVQRLTAAGWDARFVDRVFITHNHSDHSGGLGELYNFIWTDRGQKNYQPGPVEVIGPKGTKEVSEGAVSMLGPSTRIFRSQGYSEKPQPPMSSMIDVREIKEDGIVYSDDLVKVTAVENSHYDDISADSESKRYGDTSYSYRFDTPAGSIVFTGDTGTGGAVARLAQDADLLVSEVAISPANRQRPDFTAVASEKSRRSSHGGHVSPEEVGELAAKAGVSMVLLNHIVPGLDDEHDMSIYSTGVQRKFDGPVIVGQDLLEIDIAKPAN